ncbi:MAG: hypothetical protein PSN37_02265 [Alphaproteobacteria bacterium]|nr:hypothetical protein [Alphaproteobacteria bacterium]
MNPKDIAFIRLIQFVNIKIIAYFQFLEALMVRLIRFLLTGLMMRERRGVIILFWLVAGRVR